MRPAKPQQQQNQVGDIHPEGMRRGGDGVPAYMEVNGLRFLLDRPEAGWNKRQCRPVYGWGVQVAVEWNRSNRFMIQARTLSELRCKVERYPERLVQP